ncbi:MAG: MarR family transcriptional regulator [Proteobacteria bacterium]|nr:MarR family transcriptional regulator [Pseudomonadota bacterium]
MAIDQFSRSLPMMLHRTLDVVMPGFRKIFKEFGLTEQQWRVLRVLWERDEIALRELADLTLIPAPSLVGVVDRLKNMGLVARRRADSDRRIVFVYTTPAGRDIEPQVMPLVAGAYAELKQSIDTQTWEHLLAGLERICELKPRSKG